MAAFFYAGHLWLNTGANLAETLAELGHMPFSLTTVGHLETLHERIEGGSPLSLAMNGLGGLFADTVTLRIRQAKSAGHLERTFRELAADLTSGQIGGY